MGPGVLAPRTGTDTSGFDRKIAFLKLDKYFNSSKLVLCSVNVRIVRRKNMRSINCNVWSSCLTAIVVCNSECVNTIAYKLDKRMVGFTAVEENVKDVNGMGM